jgi:hypothetical protein
MSGNLFLNRDRPRPRTEHIELVRTISARDRERLLNQWERNFLSSIVNYACPTPKQMEALREIASHVAAGKRTPTRRRRRASR